MYQERGQVVWYSYLLKNFPQFVVIHTVKGFGVVNKAEVDVKPCSKDNELQFKSIIMLLLIFTYV